METPVSPLLEFDDERVAFINPESVMKQRDVPSACVLTWFGDAALRWVEEADGRVVVENNWEDGPHPVYEISHRDRRLALAPMPLGGPAAAGLLEETIAAGCRTFIACGGAGALRSDLTLGHLVVVTSALRDEGTSHHYLPAARTVDADPTAVEVLTTMFTERDVPFVTGRTWTTDAFFRETPARIARRTEEECLTVDMEAAAVAAVARFRGVPLAQVLYGGDDLSGQVWDNRAWQQQHNVRDSLLRLAGDAALRLDDAVASRSPGQTPLT